MKPASAFDLSRFLQALTNSKSVKPNKSLFPSEPSGALQLAAAHAHTKASVTPAASVPVHLPMTTSAAESKMQKTCIWRAACS